MKELIEINVVKINLLTEIVVYKISKTVETKPQIYKKEYVELTVLESVLNVIDTSGCCFLIIFTSTILHFPNLHSAKQLHITCDFSREIRPTFSGNNRSQINPIVVLSYKILYSI